MIMIEGKPEFCFTMYLCYAMNLFLQIGVPTGGLEIKVLPDESKQ